MFQILKTLLQKYLYPLVKCSESWCQATTKKENNRSNNIFLCRCKRKIRHQFFFSVSFIYNIISAKSNVQDHLGLYGWYRLNMLSLYKVQFFTSRKRYYKNIRFSVSMCFTQFISTGNLYEPISTQYRIFRYNRYTAVENTVRKGEIACNKQFLLFSRCFLPNTVLIFHFKCTLKCRLQFVSIWTSLKFCRLVMGKLIKELKSCDANICIVY